MWRSCRVFPGPCWSPVFRSATFRLFVIIVSLVARIPLVVCGTFFCYAASLLRSSAPCPHTVFRSAILRPFVKKRMLLSVRDPQELRSKMATRVCADLGLFVLPLAAALAPFGISLFCGRRPSILLLFLPSNLLRSKPCTPPSPPSTSIAAQLYVRHERLGRSPAHGTSRGS